LGLLPEHAHLEVNKRPEVNWVVRLRWRDEAALLQ
jgi:hypothetical protein